MQGDILAQGIELMLYGMGTVVVFLALLVVATTAMSAFVTRYFPEAEAPERGWAARSPAHIADAPIEGEIVAAIAAAIHQHRSKK